MACSVELWKKEIAENNELLLTLYKLILLYCVRWLVSSVYAYMHIHLIKCKSLLSYQFLHDVLLRGYVFHNYSGYDDELLVQVYNISHGPPCWLLLATRACWYLLKIVRSKVDKVHKIMNAYIIIFIY